VTSRAERDCRQLVRRALRHSPEAFVAVIGCYAQLQSDQIAAIDGVDLVLGSQDKFSLVDLINDGKKKKRPDILVSCLSENNFSFASSAGFEDRTRAFLKVQDGCDYNCTYCTIPRARGKSRSTTIVEIMRQAREAVELGYKELVLTGVNVGDYGKNDGSNLLSLLKELVTIDGLLRLRISSVEPNLLTDELLDFWISHDNVCNHWHIPLQSGSDEILRKMRRRYLTGMYAERIEKIKSKLPSAGIGTDVIVGFPGESEEFFKETCTFLQDLPVSYFHIFSYSERPMTSAAESSQKIQPKIRAERSKILHRMGVQKRKTFYESFIGKTVPVLFESEHPEKTISGLTEEYVRVDVKSDIKETNIIKDVVITGAFSENCIGKIADTIVVPAIRIAI
jgi:threonylcarbamoyladenosine tRNA methylthiotransferase MtaB